MNDPKFNKDGDEYLNGNCFALSPLCDSDGVNIQKWFDTDADKEVGPDPIEKSQIAAQPEQPEEEPQAQTVEKGVDNVQPTSYITNKPSKLIAPDTVPITKSDITGNVENGEENNSVENPEEKPTNTIDQITDEPITKDQINPKDSELARTFTDLTKRMDNLYRDEEKEKEEWH